VGGLIMKAPAIPLNTGIVLAGMGLAVVVYLWLKKKGAAGVGAAVGGAAADAAAGVVVGVGGALGIPETNAAKCAQAKADGDLWGQSLYCPAWDFTTSAPSQAVLAIGDVLSVPRTNQTECERAKAEGRTLDASFACDAGTWLKYVFTGK